MMVRTYKEAKKLVLSRAIVVWEEPRCGYEQGVAVGFRSGHNGLPEIECRMASGFVMPVHASEIVEVR